jgi:hypothetical protein
MRKLTNTLSPSPKGFQSPKFSDSDFWEVRGLGRPKSSAICPLCIRCFKSRQVPTRCHKVATGQFQEKRRKIPHTYILGELPTGTFWCLVSRSRIKLSLFLFGRLGCSSTTFSAQLTACHRDLARHFKTDPNETVAIWFGYPKKTLFEPTVSTG